jgi:hypothetical protein
VIPTFVHSNLFWLWGVPTLSVAAIPVLIHLINMLRQRRVAWAAMEFLLASQRKHRTWIILKQLLLLLLRMIAVAAVVLLVAEPRLQSDWPGWLGGARTHHIVLLDDSFSMSDRWADSDAFAEGKKVVRRIAAGAARQEGLHWFTLLRFSRAVRAGQPPAPDQLKVPLGSDFGEKLEPLLAKMKVTETAAGPEPALDAVPKLCGGPDSDRRIIYLVSDFRARDWSQRSQLPKLLRDLSRSGSEFRLINCVDRQRPNLAIESLLPEAGIRAAGVQWFMDVAVRNFGPGPARRVSVTLGEDGHGRTGIVLDEIPPGKTAVERFPVNFPGAGQHDITARLESDAVAADNHRYATVGVPPDVPVLLVDGDARARDARLLSIALAPGGSVRTGIRPQIETPRYLSLKPLADFRAIDLANIERLDASAVAALEKYVAAGGGLAVFLGEHTDVKFFNDVLYRDGKGLFPVPLAGQAELLLDRLEPAPDLEVQRGFILDVFKRIPLLLPTVSIERYFAVPRGWEPSANSTVRVLARLRGGAPLVVERPVGKGRVVAFLTTAAPTWNNWGASRSFVAVVLDLHAYLSAPADVARSTVVGAPLVLPVDPGRYQPAVRFTAPAGAALPAATITASRAADATLAAVFRDTDVAGFYEARLARADNTVETRRYAVNVDPAEGDLAIIGAEQLASRLEGVKYQYVRAAAFQAAAADSGGYNLREPLLYGLVLLLIGEQLLAWSASYHAKRGQAFVPAGGGQTSAAADAAQTLAPVEAPRTFASAKGGAA